MISPSPSYKKFKTKSKIKISLYAKKHGVALPSVKRVSKVRKSKMTTLMPINGNPITTTN